MSTQATDHDGEMPGRGAHTLRIVQQVEINPVHFIEQILILRESLGEVFPIRPDICASGAVDALEIVAKLEAWTAAMRNELLVHACGIEPVSLTEETSKGDRSVGDLRATEVAAILCVTPTRARNMVHEARILTCELSNVHQALVAGDITPYKSSLAAQGFSQLRIRYSNSRTEQPANLAERYERRVLTRAPLQTIGELRRTIDKSVALLSPKDEKAIRETARSERFVSISDAPNSMSWLNALLPSEDASRVYQVLTHSARNDTSLSGSQTQKMADALVKIVDGTSDVSAELRNKAAELQVMVAFDALAGVANGNPEARLVGEIASTGLLIEGDALRNLINDSKFRRLVFDSKTGQLLDYGRTTYQPPANLRGHVTSRDFTCRAPGCDRPAKYCDVDHVIPYQDGGETNANNLATLCRTHHLLKTHGDWQYMLDANGRTRWRLPGNQTKSKELDNRYSDLALHPCIEPSLDSFLNRKSGMSVFDEVARSVSRQNSERTLRWSSPKQRSTSANETDSNLDWTEDKVGADDDPPF